MPVVLSQRNNWRQFWPLADDWKTRRLVYLCPFAAAFRFSARLGWTGRGSQTWQQFVDRVSHLLGSRWALRTFPRTALGFHQIACQHQMVVHHRDHVAPSLKLLRGPQAGLLPQEGLLVKAIAVLLPKSQGISQRNLSQIRLWLTDPHKPTHAWIPFFVGRVRSHDAQNGQLQPASLLDMHLLPPGHFHGTLFGIHALPGAIWLCMGRHILGLELVSIFAGCPFFARWNWGNPVQTAVVSESTQYSNPQPTAPTPQPGRIIASIQRDNRLGWKMRKQTSQLRRGDLNGGGLRGHSLLIQNVRPAPWCWWQDNQRRKLPSKRDRVLAFWQVMHVLCGTICRGHGIRACYFTRIDSQPEPFLCIRFGKRERKDFSHPLFIDASIFKGFIQRRPFSLKPRRLREFRKRFGRRLGQKSINGIEQGTFRFHKTVIQLVTKLSDCVNVIHTSKLPLVFDTRNLLGLASFRKVWGPFIPDSLNVKLGKGSLFHIMLPFAVKASPEIERTQEIGRIDDNYKHDR